MERLILMRHGHNIKGIFGEMLSNEKKKSKYFDYIGVIDLKGKVVT
jgi:hypothetical protein